VVRRLGLLAVPALALVAWALGAGSAHAQSQSSTYWCSAHPSYKTCVVSATYDGSALTPSDPNYDVWASPYQVPSDTAKTVQWSIQPLSADDLSAALGHTFSITIKTDVIPREIDAFGASMTYTRSGPSSGEYEVTITGQPVEVSKQTNCTYPPGGPICTGNSPGSLAIFQGEIDDFNYKLYDSPDYPAGLVDSFAGMDMWTNIAETGLPPTIDQSNGQNELKIDLADYHFESDGTTRVHGDYYLRIPESFLSTMWGINDPSTLATDGLDASIGAGGGTLSVTVEPVNTGVQVSISGMTFSRRKLEIKLGRVTPHAPTHIKVRRLGSTSAKVTFHPAKPRGQKVTGYALRCAPNGGGPLVTVKGRRSPLVAAGLGDPEGYRCTLRARSRAGYGSRSPVFRIP
jgi:hypothetical protein